MFPRRAAGPHPAPATPAAAPAAAASSSVFTIGNTDSPTPPAHAAARNAAPARGRREARRAAEAQGHRRELRAAELCASSLQSEVDATKLKALTKIRAQDEQPRQLRAALDGAEAQRRRPESEKRSQARVGQRCRRRQRFRLSLHLFNCTDCALLSLRRPGSCLRAGAPNAAATDPARSNPSQRRRRSRSGHAPHAHRRWRSIGRTHRPGSGAAAPHGLRRHHPPAHGGPLRAPGRGERWALCATLAA